MSERRAEDILAEQGVYVSTTAGSSMWPMLRHRRDTVTVTPLHGEAKKYDVVLFRRGEKLVLHRVVGFTPDAYLIRGDHCAESERVEKTRILGVLSAFTRGGSPRSVTAPAYVVYSRLIVWLHPLLCLAARLRRGVFASRHAAP